MIVIPAIDLRAGRVVRLLRGDFDQETAYDEAPVAVARRFEEEGARRLHVVDLDGASGAGTNRRIVREICRSVAIPVQVGGGIRTRASLERAIEDGADRVIVGTAAALEPGFVAEAVGVLGEHVVVGLDVREGRVMTHGWRSEGPGFDDALSAVVDAGAQRLIVTSVARDGTMEGPDLPLYRRVTGMTDLSVVAAGGVRSPADVRALRDLGLEACVVGKAIHDGRLRLQEVVRG